MANVNIKFNNKDYLLSCDDGQEESLKKLTSFLDKKYNELLREQKYLKGKITSLEQELSKKSENQEKFSREIDELNQETEELVEEIDKWQI